MEKIRFVVRLSCMRSPETSHHSPRSEGSARLSTDTTAGPIGAYDAKLLPSENWGGVPVSWTARSEMSWPRVRPATASHASATATLDVSEDHWDAIMNINAKAVFFASQAVLPTMIAQKSGSIVSLASMAGKIGSKTNLPYNASKAAVVSMTKSLALAHAGEGIRVNCVCPGFVETDMWTMVSRDQGKLLGMTAEEFTRQRASQVPLGRMETPQDVAHVVAFLAGPRSGYMTGQALSVDGGLVMH